jgi:CheY-like chemotaxis protein
MSSPKSPSYSILLVDDNKLGLVARKHVLEELGYRATTAASANAALDLFGRNSYDLVITDYRMPDMSGIDMIQKFRKVQPAVPIILISGFAEVLGLDEETTGADMVICKSASEVNQLVRAVGRLLAAKKNGKKPVSAVKPELRTRKKTS